MHAQTLLYQTGDGGAVLQTVTTNIQVIAYVDLENTLIA